MPPYSFPSSSPGLFDGCTQEENIQSQRPKPPGIGLAGVCAGAKHVPSVRVGQTAAPSVQGMRLVRGP